MINHTFSYGDLEVYLLIVVRIMSFIFVCPFFGGRQTPNIVKVGYGLLLSILLYGAVPFYPPDYNTVAGYTVIVLKEAMVGLLIGFAVTLCQQITAFAGSVVDMQIGLSMVSMMDPATSQQVTITGSLYSQYLTLALIITGMYQYILKALVDWLSNLPSNLHHYFHNQRGFGSFGEGFTADEHVLCRYTDKDSCWPCDHVYYCNNAF